MSEPPQSSGEAPRSLPPALSRAPGGPGRLRRAWRGRRPLLVAFALSAASSGVLGFLPLLGGPGYEMAVVAGLLLPFLAAMSAALDVLNRARSGPADRAGQARATPVGLVADSLLGAGIIWLIFCAINLLHGLRSGLCEPFDDLKLMALGPGVGTLLGGAWGALVGLWLADRGARRAALSLPQRSPRATRSALLFLCVALPLFSIGISVWRFLTSPMVFAYDPFVGYFSGSIYDTVINYDGLVSYRLGSLCSLLALLAACAHLTRDALGRVRFRRRQLGLALAGLVAALCSLWISLSGPRFGHYYTTADIKAELGGELSYGRCDLAYDRSLPRDTMTAIARDCDAHIHALEAYFGAPGPERITAYFFASASRKQQLMGAMSVYIAKPWRREVYLQAEMYPHSVLGHELAHVVAGAYARGPFKVPGRVWGVFANPGLIEGMAVAAAPDEDADLTLQQWARAMRELGLLPPLSRVFHLGFLGENSSTAYTVAGAFVEWFRTNYGSAKLRGWYAGQTLEQLSGQRLPALEQRWLSSLDAVEVPPEAMGVAKARFDRPAVFGRHCPHAVDRLFAGARALLGADPSGSEANCREVLKLEPDHLGARLTLADARAAQGDLGAARDGYRAIAGDQRLSASQRALGLETLGDLELVAGDPSQASELYKQVMGAIVGEDKLRSLELRSEAQDSTARQALVALLIGTGGKPRDWIDAADLLGRWAEREPQNGLPEYLLGKNLYGNGRFDLALPRLLAANHKQISNRRARAEALRTLLFVACARADLPVATRAYADYASLAEGPAARRAGVRAFARRCGAAAAGEESAQ